MRPPWLTHVGGRGRAPSGRGTALSAPVISAAERSTSARSAPEGVVGGPEDGGKAGHAPARRGGEVGPAEEGRPVGGQEHGHRPAPLAGHRLDRLHVDRVEVGALLAIDLDVDEELVHQGGDPGVLEALVGHHVAPVAGAVPDGEEDRAVRLPRDPQRLLPPRIPVDRVAGVLPEVGAGLGREAVGHGGGLRRWRRWAAPTSSDRGRAGRQQQSGDDARARAATTHHPPTSRWQRRRRRRWPRRRSRTTARVSPASPRWPADSRWRAGRTSPT